MPTSANKDIVESKYSKYGENNMIIEGFINEHNNHETEETMPDEEKDYAHKHTIPVTKNNEDESPHEQLMDCYAVEDGDTEIIELVPKPIPKFGKNNKVGLYIMIIFIAFFVIFILYCIVTYFWNKMNPENFSGTSKTS